MEFMILVGALNQTTLRLIAELSQGIGKFLALRFVVTGKECHQFAPRWRANVDLQQLRHGGDAIARSHCCHLVLGHFGLFDYWCNKLGGCSTDGGCRRVTTRQPRRW